MRQLVVFLVLLLPTPALGQTVRFVPAAASTGGAYGTFWSTDVRIFNPDPTADIRVEVTFLEGNRDNTDATGVPVTVPARRAVALDDVVGGLLDEAGSGGLRLSSTGPLFATSRTFNSGGGGGTYGQLIPAVPAREAMANGILLQLANRPGDGGFRTNVGFLNPGEAPVSVVARLLDGSIGVELGTLERTVAPLGWLQVDDVFAEAGVPGSAVDNATLELTADAPLFAYASVIDNTSGDPVYVAPFADAGGGDIECLAPGTYARELDLGGFNHQFELYVPPAAGPNAALIVQLHGGGSTGAAMDLVSGLTQMADEQGFLVLTPEGWEIPALGARVWNGGACCGPTDQEPDHVAAISAMLDAAAALGACFDPRRIYATGHSNGGIMSYRLACELSDRIAAVAVSAGYLADVDLSAGPPEQVFACEPSRPVPILHVHGLADQCVPYAGGFSDATGNTNPPIEDVIAGWRARNGCSAGTDRTEGGVRRRSWPCTGSTTVELITVEPLGHAWAGSDIYGNPGLCGGTTTRAVSTTQEAWRFFQGHTLP